VNPLGGEAADLPIPLTGSTDRQEELESGDMAGRESSDIGESSDGIDIGSACAPPGQPEASGVGCSVRNQADSSSRKIGSSIVMSSA